MSRRKPVAKIEFKNFYISPMTEHDLLEVVEIEEMCGLSRWGWDAYHTELVQGDQKLMLVTRNRKTTATVTGERIGGFIAARLISDEIHINYVAVRPAHRGLGIGGNLLNAVLKEGARLGARGAILEVRASNAVAQSLYLRYGFRIAGRRSNYYSEPTEDALIMDRPI